MNNDQPYSRSHTVTGNIAIAALTLAILSFLSPQVGMLGRGLRTTLPALMISFFAISMVSPSAFMRAFVRFRATFLLGFIFLAQGALRFVNETYRQDVLWHGFFNAPLLVLIFLLWIAALSELGDDAVQRLRSWLLFGWCLSIAVSLPILIEHPGIARTTMGNRNELVNAAKWAPRGVAEYSVYTTIGICLGPLFAVTRKMGFFWRWCALLLICMTTVAVLFSTFTMAALMLMASLICMLLIWAMAGRGAMRMFRLLVILFPLAMLPTLYVLSNNFEQTKFIVTKVERLTKNISNKGLAKGDETNRGKMFADEMNSFFEEPFMGYIPGVTGQRGHGHSSFANSLVLFGIFGALLWVAALYKVFKISLDNTRDQFDQHAAKVAWLVFVLSGILNPIWHATAALAALFALTLPARKINVPAADER
jgi:hypothetical protein